VPKTFGVTLVGVKQFRTRLRVLNKDVASRVRKTVADGAAKVVAGAKSRVPVDTGELKATIRAEFSDDGTVAFVKAGYGKLKRKSKNPNSARSRRAIAGHKRRGTFVAKSYGAGVYAPVVEYGDSSAPNIRKARPFMHPSMEEQRPRLIKQFRDDLRGATDSAARAS